MSEEISKELGASHMCSMEDLTVKYLETTNALLSARKEIEELKAKVDLTDMYKAEWDHAK